MGGKLSGRGVVMSRPEMIGPQAQALVFAMDAHRSIAGRALSANEVVSVLDVVARTERVALMHLVRGPEIQATQNPISHALPGGPGGQAEDDHGPVAYATGWGSGS